MEVAVGVKPEPGLVPTTVNILVDQPVDFVVSHCPFRIKTHDPPAGAFGFTPGTFGPERFDRIEQFRESVGKKLSEVQIKSYKPGPKTKKHKGGSHIPRPKKRT